MDFSKLNEEQLHELVRERVFDKLSKEYMKNSNDNKEIPVGINLGIIDLE